MEAKAGALSAASCRGPPPGLSAAEEGGRATAAAPPSSKVQGHPSNNIGDNRVGDTSDTTRVGDISDTGRAPVQHSRSRAGDINDTGRAPVQHSRSRVGNRYGILIAEHMSLRVTVRAACKAELA